MNTWMISEIKTILGLFGSGQVISNVNEIFIEDGPTFFYQ